MATANKNLSDFDYSQVPSAKDMKIGILVSEWNEQITEGLYQGAMEALNNLWMHQFYSKRCSW